MVKMLFVDNRFSPILLDSKLIDVVDSNESAITKLSENKYDYMSIGCDIGNSNTMEVLEYLYINEINIPHLNIHSDSQLCNILKSCWVDYFKHPRTLSTVNKKTLLDSNECHLLMNKTISETKDDLIFLNSIIDTEDFSVKLCKGDDTITVLPGYNNIYDSKDLADNVSVLTADGYSITYNPFEKTVGLFIACIKWRRT